MGSRAKRPTPRRLLLSVLMLFCLWGLIFGWIDGDLWTMGNWLEALAMTAIFLVGMYVVILVKFRDA
jgi:hypothetical protein